jgi:hypothetical protein
MITIKTELQPHAGATNRDEQSKKKQEKEEQIVLITTIELQ